MKGNYRTKLPSESTLSGVWNDAYFSAVFRFFPAYLVYLMAVAEYGVPMLEKVMEMGVGVPGQLFFVLGLWIPMIELTVWIMGDKNE